MPLHFGLPPEFDVNPENPLKKGMTSQLAFLRLYDDWQRFLGIL
jgi:hypothetical protein